MKKLFISLMCLTATIAGQALTPGAFTAQKAPAKTVEALAPAKADDNDNSNALWFSYCTDEIAMALGANTTSDYYVSAAIKLDENTVQSFNGSEIKKMMVGLGNVYYDEIYIYVTTDLTQEPVIYESHTIDTSRGGYTWYELEFDTPYTITGEPVYIGYSYKTKGQTYSIGSDGIVSKTKLGDFAALGIVPEPNALEFDNIGSQFGNVSIKVELSGQLPEWYPVFGEVFIPELVRVNQPFTATIGLRNFGTAPITTAQVETTVGTGDPVVTTITLDEPIEPSQSGKIMVDYLEINEIASTPVTIKVTAINGVATEATFKGNVSGTMAQSNRMMVVEEATSNGCVWCPRGIVAMEYMNQNYPDGFIGIAAHMTGQGNDPMIIKSYSSLGSFVDGMPGCVVNRSTGYTNDVEAYTLEQVYLTYFDGAAALADIDLEAGWLDDEKTQLYMLSTTTMGFSASNTTSKYRVNFVITEDNVGPYKQKNAYAGGAAGEMDGWEKRGTSVSTLFNDVARWTSSFYGATSTLPASLTAGESYQCYATCDLSTLKNAFNADIVVNTDNISIIAMVLQNTPSKSILNAVKIPASAIKDVSGIENVGVNTPAGPATYYDLTGMRVANPLPGKIYIVVRDGQASKMLYK